MSLNTPHVSLTDLSLKGDLTNVLAARGDSVHLVRLKDGTFEGGELVMDKGIYNYSNTANLTGTTTSFSTIPVLSTRPTNPPDGTIIINTSTGYRIETYTENSLWVKADGSTVY
jgi:hypothetical protein